MVTFEISINREQLVAKIINVKDCGLLTDAILLAKSPTLYRFNVIQSNESMINFITFLPVGLLRLSNTQQHNGTFNGNDNLTLCHCRRLQFYHVNGIEIFLLLTVNSISSPN